MKCTIPEISWHNREPILSVDIHPAEDDFYRLATGGSDCHVLIWHGKETENGGVSLDVVSDLTRHQKSVNIVRWSPTGQYLASADDDANIIIWNLKTDNIPLLEGDSNDKEVWVVAKILRGHKEDVYDLCWSPNGLKLLSGSIDNTAIVWDFQQGKLENILTDHKGFVQGVCWDPKGDYLATLSSDRICRIFEKNGKRVRSRISKGILPLQETHFLHNKEVKYFHDDTFKSFFRRITFTPDGNLIIAPAGCVETETTKKALCGTYLFTLDELTQPAAILPLEKQCSVAVRCCPILYEIRTDGPEPAIDLPYRMIIAVATESDLILYDTQQLTPFAHLQKIHYTRLTDLAWSSNGKLLAACSTDGFCTLVTFEQDELGTPYTKEESEVEESFLNVSGCEELDKSIAETPNKEEKSKKVGFLIQWANKTREENEKGATGRKDNEECKENEQNGNDVSPIETIEISDSPIKVDKNNITPRRITPIQLVASADSKKKSASKVTPKRRKGNQTPNNRSKETNINSLMSFIKNSNKTSEIPANISEESSNARDAWNDEAPAVIIQDDDDMTEPIPDFKLQIEESETSPCKMQKEQEKISEKVEDMDVDLSDNVNENTRKSQTKVASKVESSECGKNDLKKTPRRIQLITLNSPKHKKQKSTT